MRDFRLERDYTLKKKENVIGIHDGNWCESDREKGRTKEREKESVKVRDIEEWASAKEKKKVSHANATTTTTLDRLCYFAADLIVYCHVLL